MAGTSQTANFTYFKSGIGVETSTGTYVDSIGTDGSIDSPIASTALVLTGASANILAVGRQGTTNPVLNVDASTASVVTGLNLKGAAAAAGMAVSVTSSGTNESLTLDAKGSGTISLGTVSTGAIVLGTATGVTGAITGTSASASALAVGRQGATNPVLQVDASTATVLTGLKVKGAGTGAGLALSVVEIGGTNNALTVDAMGSGTISFGTVSTGNIVLGRATTGVSLSVTGAVTAKSGTAVPATAGAVAAGAPLVNNSNGMTIEWTTDAPTHTRPKGSLCINLGGSSSSTRLYVNSDGAGTWIAITTAS